MADRAIIRFSGAFRFLSNFYMCDVWHDGVSYQSVEHAYQSLKIRKHEDAVRVSVAKTPGEAKRMARRSPMRQDWDRIKLGVMRKLVANKFRAGTELAERLLATGDAELIEGNDWGDTYWGVCNGVGDNHLGGILMEVRHALRDEEPAF